MPQINIVSLDAHIVTHTALMSRGAYYALLFTMLFGIVKSVERISK